MPSTVPANVVVTVAPEICHSPAAISASPAAMVSLVPMTRTSRADGGATTTRAAAAGSTRTPACNGV